MPIENKQATEMNTKTSTRTLALIIIFVALAVALNVYGPKIPFPLAPFLFFQLWEIPIVIAFLAIGVKPGVAVAVINSIVLVFVFQGELPTGPFYNLIAVLSMFLGIYIPYKIATLRCRTESLTEYLRHHKVIITIAATASGMATRILITTVVNYFALQQPYPIGFGLPQIDALLFLPAGAVFNAIVALYTIPLAFAITVAVTSRVKIQ